MGYRELRKLSDIKALYEKAKIATKNFKKIEPETLEACPEILTVIRLGLGLSQRNFAKALGITRASLAHYELGNKYMKAPRKMAVTDKVNALLPKIELAEIAVASNFKHFWVLAKRGHDTKTMRERGRAGIKNMKPTIQESKIATLLEKSKIDFQKAAFMDLDGMKFSFDFVVPDSHNPKALIECKTINAKSKRNMRIISYRIGYEIAYKFKLVELRSPSIKRIFILNTNYKNLPERVISILRKETNTLLINPSEKEILKYLNSV